MSCVRIQRPWNVERSAGTAKYKALLIHALRWRILAPSYGSYKIRTHALRQAERAEERAALLIGGDLN